MFEPTTQESLNSRTPAALDSRLLALESVLILVLVLEMLRFTASE